MFHMIEKLTKSNTIFLILTVKWFKLIFFLLKYALFLLCLKNQINFKVFKIYFISKIRFKTISSIKLLKIYR
jgi:hypothetical protein